MDKIAETIKSYLSLTMAIIALVGVLVGYLTGIKVTQHDVEELKREMIESYKLHYKHAETTGKILQFMGE